MTLHKHAWRLSVKEVLSLLTPFKNGMWDCCIYFFSIQVIHEQQFHPSHAHEVKANSTGIFHLRLQLARLYLQCWTEGQWLPSTAPQFGRGKSAQYATRTSSHIVCCEELGMYCWRAHHWAIPFTSAFECVHLPGHFICVQCWSKKFLSLKEDEQWKWMWSCMMWQMSSWAKSLRYTTNLSAISYHCSMSKVHASQFHPTEIIYNYHTCCSYLHNKWTKRVLLSLYRSSYGAHNG